jgi:hypothetical protein
LYSYTTSTGDATSFSLSPDGTVYSLALSPTDDELYSGGDFTNKYAIYSEDVSGGGDDETPPADEDDGGGRGGGHQKPIIKTPKFHGDTNLIELLRSLIQQFIAQGGTPSPAMLAFLGTPGGASSDYTRDLDLNSEGSDVTALQLFLIAQNKGPQAQALAVVGATGFFGPLTQAALAEYQASVGITPAVGFFGPVTRAYISGL